MMGYLDVLKVLLLFLAIAKVKSDCSSEINVCNLMLTSNYGTSSLDFSKPNNVTFRELVGRCPGFKATIQCFRGAFLSCPVEVADSLQGVIDYFEYFCGEGMAKALEYSDCLSSRSVVDEVFRCGLDYQAASNVSAGPNSNFALCQATMFYLICSGMTVDRFCGNPAASYWDTLLRISLVPQLKLINCVLPATVSTASTLSKASIVSIGLTFICKFIWF